MKIKTTELLQGTSGTERAAALLKAGELVAVPTETVYGLAADASNPGAVSKIFKAKGRPANHPLIVHIGHTKQLQSWASDLPAEVELLAKAFWPGPLTLLLPKADNVSPVVTGGRDSVGVRMPAHPILLALLQQTGLAIAAPSANPYKKLSPTSASQVLAGLNGKIAAVLDGGDCELGLESTILDLTGAQPQVLRAGPISADEISNVLGAAVDTPKTHDVAVPGNVKAHYQPDTPILILSHQELIDYLPTNQNIVLICHSAHLAGRHHGAILQLPPDHKIYGKLLYKTLFDADRMNGSQIWLEAPPQTDLWAAVNDRLSRAAYK